ncbi:MAG: hypothetical protein H7A33_03550 [Deltaproteobacteria bacterium]|nr:hypothetical protein [Deltaproteobacteria bacterium]
MITSPTDYLKEATDKNQVVGTWGFNSNMDFTRTSPEETNVWFFEQVFNFLRAFFGLVMPDNLEIITHNAAKHIKRENLDQQTFLDELMLVLKELKEPIWTFRLNLNLVGFIRSHSDPDNPVRIQIQEPSSFIAWGGPDESGFQNFSISYNLFSDSTLHGSDEMLWSLNQPLLEKGLKKWEMQTGRVIEVVQSNAKGRGAQPSRYGFKRPTAAGRRRPTRTRPPAGEGPTSSAKPVKPKTAAEIAADQEKLAKELGLEDGGQPVLKRKKRN